MIYMFFMQTIHVFTWRRSERDCSLCSGLTLLVCASNWDLQSAI